MASIAASGIVLEPLREDNYENWGCLVRNYLMGQGLWEVVSTSVFSAMSVGSKEKVEAWNKDNAKALHIIQLACGSGNLTRIRDHHTAKEAWNYLAATHGRDLRAESDNEEGMVDEILLDYNLLHKYIERGEWEDAISLINRDLTAIFSTSSTGRTVLHVAVIAGYDEIVKELVKIGKDKLLNMRDMRGYTALAIAAEKTGSMHIAEHMISKSVDLDLLSIKTANGETPLLIAAASGHKQMTSYLYRCTRSEDLLDQNYGNGVLLFTRCIHAEIFDVALSLLQQFPQMPLVYKSESKYEFDGVQPLYAFARMPNVFPSSSRYGFIQGFLYKILRIPERINKITMTQTSVDHKEKQPQTSFAGRILICIHISIQNLVLLKLPGLRGIYNQKMTHSLVLEILKCLYERIKEFKDSELRRASVYDVMLQAAKQGNIEFINAMRMAKPDLILSMDENRRGVISHAILNRRKTVFNLLQDATVYRRIDLVAKSRDKFGNSLLHLAGYNSELSSSLRSPALQMQEEILWFKAVEAMVHPKYKEAKNEEGKIPREIFTENHEKLMKEGEKWAKETAASFTIVATLITAIMFTTAFTVPGGNNQDSGDPLFLHDKIFKIFIIADAISLFTSLTSVLLFIGILTGRYAEAYDFLESLSLKFLFALIALFLSVVSMIVAFCASFAMLLKGHQGVIVTTFSLASIPVIVLVPSQLRLFDMFKYTVYPIDLYTARIS